jgi:hypothetical protein
LTIINTTLLLSISKFNKKMGFAMPAYALSLSTAEAEAFPTHCLPLERHWADGLTPAETAFVAGLRSLMVNNLIEGCNIAAKKFLESAPTAKAVRRRAYALLRLAGEGDQ